MLRRLPRTARGRSPLGRSFAWSLTAFAATLVVTGTIVGVYVRTVFRYRTAVEDAATEVAGVVLRDVFDVLFARLGGAAFDVVRGPFTVASGSIRPARIGAAEAAARSWAIADSLDACRCGRWLPVGGVATYDPLAGVLETAGPLSMDAWHARIDGLHLEDDERLGRLRTAAGGEPNDPWFLYLVAAPREGAGPLWFILDVPLDRMGSELLGPTFRRIIAGHPLTSRAGPDAASLDVRHPSGAIVYRGGGTREGPTFELPLFGRDLGSVSLDDTRPLGARITLDRAAVPAIIPGGVPGSPWPLAIASVALTLTLAAIGLTLLLRVRSFALARERFLASVSHELRTPLAQLLAYAETLELDRPTPASRRRASGVILRETRRMIGIVENALAFFRADREGPPVDTRRVELVGAVEEVVADFAPLAEPRGVTIRVDAPDRVDADVDPLALRLVLNNLLENAVRHGPRDEEVVVRVREGEGYAELSVADRGSGIPPAVRARIWEPFQRGGGGGAEGTGLGLSIVRRLVEAHGGTVSCADGEQGGTVFTLRVPSNPRLDALRPEAQWRAS